MPRRKKQSPEYWAEKNKDTLLKLNSLVEKFPYASLGELAKALNISKLALNKTLEVTNTIIPRPVDYRKMRLEMSRRRVDPNKKVKDKKSPGRAPFTPEERQQREEYRLMKKNQNQKLVRLFEGWNNRHGL
jgi:hypothetical protein